MIVIVCNANIGFPNGTAPTGRVTAYARGLIEQGSKVLVLCTMPSEVPEIGILNTATKGNVNGVEFEYTCGTTVFGDTFVRRRWLWVKGTFVAARRILSMKGGEGIEAILLFSDTLCHAFWFWFVARLYGAAYLLERNEHPFYGREQKGWRKLYAKFYLHTVYRLFDGIVVISDFLLEHMKQYMKRRASLLKIPILVDTELFTHSPEHVPIGGQYIAYCGLLNEAKDGVLTLLKSFALISGEFRDLKLVLIGDSYGKSQIPVFKRYAEELGVGDRVIFTGTISRDMLPSYLCRATVLALARPSSIQAKAGFPSKVGEYLATGNPVVLTRTGELASYLEDRKSVYFVPPDDHIAFADRLRHVMSNIDEARQVGKEGCHVARFYFDYRANSKYLLEFIKNMHKSERPLQPKK